MHTPSATTERGTPTATPHDDGDLNQQAARTMTTRIRRWRRSQSPSRRVAVPGKTRRTAAGLAGCVLGIAALLSASPPATAAPALPGTNCQHISIPAGLGPGTRDDQLLSGTLCIPSNAPDPHAVDILIHGYTYNSNYWNFPGFDGRYSFVNRELAAGQPTFAYDRLGDGASTRPPATSLTAASDAYNLDQVIQALRGRGYTISTVIGHSWGSLVAAQAAATYPADVPRLVLTGLLHTTGPAVPEVFPNLVPWKPDDPSELGYVTTKLGARKPLFYSESADPAVIAQDEATKDAGSLPQISSAVPGQFTIPPPLATTEPITAPVLLEVGQQDRLFCPGVGVSTATTLDCADTAAVRGEEAPFYPHAASLSVVTIPNTGHDLPLHPTAGQSFEAIHRWEQTTAGST